MSFTSQGAVGVNELMDVKGLAWSLVQSKGFQFVCHEIGEEVNKLH